MVSCSRYDGGSASDALQRCSGRPIGPTYLYTRVATVDTIRYDTIRDAILTCAQKLPGWRRGVVVGGVHRMNEVNARRARLAPGWVTVFGRVYTISVCNKPTRSTRPYIPPGSLNRVPATAGVRVGMSPLPGGR